MPPPTTDWPEIDPSPDELEPGDEPSPGGGGTPASRSGRSRRAATLARWSRLVHVYSSMVLLLLVLFFGATGITLNHPEWTFGFHPSTTTVTGTVPATAKTGGEIQLLALSEYLRQHDGVAGDVDEFGLTPTSGYLSYRGPGYAADVTIDVKAGTYKLETEKQGLIGVLNDLHKGRSTSALWGHVIDIAGAVLVITALAGLLLQLALRKRRTAALVVAAVGGGIATWIAISTLA